MVSILRCPVTLWQEDKYAPQQQQRFALPLPHEKIAWVHDCQGSQKKSTMPEVESSRTSLASRTHFEVLGLGLEATSPRKLPCPWLEDSTIFEPLKFCRKTPVTLRKICKYLFYFAQLEHRLSQPGLPPNWNFTNDQNVTKKPVVSSVSVSS